MSVPGALAQEGREPGVSSVMGTCWRFCARPTLFVNVIPFDHLAAVVVDSPVATSIHCCALLY